MGAVTLAELQVPEVIVKWEPKNRFAGAAVAMSGVFQYLVLGL